MYRFIKNYTKGGTKICAGVSLKNTILQNGLISVEGSDFIKGIPLEYFEEFEPQKFAAKLKPELPKKRGRPKKIKHNSFSQRI